MGTYTANWEDDDNNRQVEFSVAYAIENDEVEIKDVTPTKVSFVCPENKSITRTIGVHTAHGREMLASQLRRSPRMSTMVGEIQDTLLEPIA